MKFSTQEQIEKLSRFQGGAFFITSFYLNSDKSKQTKKEISVSSKNLLTHARTQLAALDLSREKRESINQDLDKISVFCSQSLGSHNHPGLAIFSCSDKDTWQELSLPHPPRDRVIFDQNPYVRPLSAILGRYHPICAFLAGRREAEWYEVHMAEIVILDQFKSDVPGKVREGGWEGYESKRIERHISAHLHEHLKAAAQKTFELLKKNHYTWLFLGCPDEYFADLEPLLHPYLKPLLKGRLKARPGDPPDKILKEVLKLEIGLQAEEEEEIVQRFVSELERGGLAISGLKDTLRALNQAGVQTLVVTHNFSRDGRICPVCRLLYVDELRCPSCQRKTDVAVDIIDEAIESAMNKNCQVKHITPPSKLDRYGKIGAFLRYKI
jgi:peptide subunit release factor 1 (eRF1)